MHEGGWGRFGANPAPGPPDHQPCSTSTLPALCGVRGGIFCRQIRPHFALAPPLTLPLLHHAPQNAATRPEHQQSSSPRGTAVAGEGGGPGQGGGPPTWNVWGATAGQPLHRGPPGQARTQHGTYAKAPGVPGGRGKRKTPPSEMLTTTPRSPPFAAGPRTTAQQRRNLCTRCHRLRVRDRSRGRRGQARTRPGSPPFPWPALPHRVRLRGPTALSSTR